MKQWLIKKAINWLGGVSGIIEIALKWFNENVLAKIKDKEEWSAYATDVAEFGVFLDGIFNRHQKWMSETKRAALAATINAVKELAEALKDANVTSEELDAIVEKVKAAVDAWLAAK